MSVIKFRECRRCGKVKPVSEFYKHSGRSDGLQIWCISCKAEYAKEKGAKAIQPKTKLDITHKDCRIVVTDDEILYYVGKQEITEEQLDILNGFAEYAQEQAS